MQRIAKSLVSALALGSVLALATAPPAAASRSATEVFVPCGPDRSRVLNESIAAGNEHPDVRWDIALEGGCTYTITHPYGGVNGLTAVVGSIRITTRGTPDAVIARDEAAGTAAFRVLEVEMGGRLVLDRITVRGGSAGTGAGIFNNFGTLTLLDSTLEGNHAREIGGALATNGERATTTLRNSTISDNSAVFAAGGIFNNGGTTTLDAGLVTRNTATAGVGGGILNHGHLSTLRLNDSTVTGNRAAGTAGGVFNEGNIALSRSLISRNLPNDCTGSPVQVPGCDS
ncbi:hypothetical protein ACWD4V_24065 [Streptomyces tsukubensis]